MLRKNLFKICEKTKVEKIWELFCKKQENDTAGTVSLLVKQKHFLIALQHCSEERKTAVRFYYKYIIQKTKNMFKAKILKNEKQICWQNM